MENREFYVRTYNYVYLVRNNVYDDGTSLLALGYENEKKKQHT